MAVIKTLSHLSISRSASHPASSRTSPTGTTTTMTVTPPTPQHSAHHDHPNENHDKEGLRRSRSHSDSSPKAGEAAGSPAMTSQGQRHPPSNGGSPRHRRPLSLGPSLSRRGKMRSSGPSTSATSHATANGSAAHNGLHSTSNRPLLAGLLSAGSRHLNGTLSPSTTPLNSPLGTPEIGGPARSPLAPGTLEASYVSKVGTRSRELVNRVFPAGPDHGPSHAGRGAPRTNVASELGDLLRSELNAAKSDPYVLRALVRTAIAPALTVYINRLDQALVPPSLDHSVLFIPKTVRDVDVGLPATLQYNIEVVKAAWLVRAALDDVLGTPDDVEASAPRGLVDSLSPFVSKLDAVVQKLMGPYLVTAKIFIMAKVAHFRHPDAAASHHGTAVKTLPITLTRSNPPVAHSQASTTLSAKTPARLRELATNLEALRKLFMIKLACGADSQKWVVSVASQAVWKGMLAFAARSAPLEARMGTPPSPPSATHRTGRGLLRGSGRSPSPPHRHSKSPEHLGQKEILGEIACFSIIIGKFIEGIAGLPEPDKLAGECPYGTDCEYCRQGLSVKTGEDGDLVRDAMNEALEAISASQLVLRAATDPSSLIPAIDPPAPLTVSAAFAGGAQTIVNPQATGCPTLDRAVDELPPLILLHALASRLSKEIGFRLPNEIWEDSWDDYEGELRGFVAAEQWTPEIATTMVEEVVRIRKTNKGLIGEKDLQTLAVMEQLVSSLGTV